MMKTFFSPKFKTVCSAMALFFMGATLPNNASAQNASCGFNVDTSYWFAGMPYTTRWSADGEKFMVMASNAASYPGHINTNWPIYVGNATDTSLTLTRNIQSQTGTGSSGWGAENFTPNGGLLVGGLGRYVKPSGGFVTVPGASAFFASNRSLDKDTTVFYASDGAASNPQTSMRFVNDHDPENPVFGVVIPNVSALVDPWTPPATMGDRIYYCKRPSSASLDLPYVIKCINFNGTTCPNWTDVVLSTGRIADMQIRPTDSLIFARTINASINNASGEPEAGGVVVFNKNGVLQNNFNFGNLSILACNDKPTYYPIIRFDAAGNIFGNVGSSSYCTTNQYWSQGASQIGIMKFDPQGNIDWSFYSNMLNNYSQANYSSATYFDVNPVTGMIASSLTYYQSGGRFSAIAGGNHVHGNNLPWFQNFPDNGDGAGTALAAGYGPGYNNGYNTVHMYYNNGKLKITGENASYVASNCGPVVTPPPGTPPAVVHAYGTLDCSKLAFIQAPVAGTASTLVLKVNINVDTIGVFKPISVSGSGLTLQDPNASFNATHTGLNEFYLTLVYNGTTALGQFNINVGNAGSCTADLSDPTKNNPSIINIWTPENCTYKVIGPDLK